MSQIEPLAAPAGSVAEVAEYRASPRAKPHFHTVLSASHLFEGDLRSTVTTTTSGEGAGRRVTVAASHALNGGSIRESLELAGDGRLVSRTLERRVLDADGTVSREERADFTRGPVRFPEGTYPEVMLPFVLRWSLPRRGARSFLAWSVDRFVAKVYFEHKSPAELTVAAGTFDAVEGLMYPDLNDWVSLGTVLTTLAKPLLPRYRIWFERAAPYRVLRFEGAYGPPGAPEIVLELAGTRAPS